MGCGSSKKAVRANNLQKKLNQRFPRAIEDMLFTNSHNQFVALVCNTNTVAKNSVLSEADYILPFIGTDNEGEKFTSVETHVRGNFDQQSGKFLKEKISEEHKAVERESEENRATEENTTEIINTWELMEGLDDGEACHVSKKNETDKHTLSVNRGDICEELIDESPPTRISRRSKSLESFHAVEEYDAFLARSKRSLWDRNSKRHLYYLGHENRNIFRSTSLSRLSSCTQFSLQRRNMAPIVGDWKEDSKDADNSTLEFPVLQPCFELRDTKHYVDSQENKDTPQTFSENNSSEENDGIAQTLSENNGSQENSHGVEVNTGNIDWKEDSKDEDNDTLEFPVFQTSFELRETKHYVESQENKDTPQTFSENNSSEENNGIAQTVSENNGSQESNHSVEMNTGNNEMVETNSEKAQSLEINSRKNIMQVRAKLNDLLDIIIPTTPDSSAVGSLKEWLPDEAHLYSSGESAFPRFGSSGFGDILSKLNFASSSSQLSSDEPELETYSFPVLSIDGKFTNNGESSIYSESGDSAIENKQWDLPPFDPELLASLDRDLEQMFQEEQHLLRQIDGDSKFAVQEVL